MLSASIEDKEKQEPLAEDEHLIHLWEPFDFSIDESYDFVPHNVLFSLFSNLLYYGIATPILWVLTKLCFDFTVEGKENLEGLHGKVTVSNHVHFLDCAMSALAISPCKLYFTSLESNFKIPLVRHLIRLLNTLPIPKDVHGKKAFIQSIDSLLQNGHTVHFYPEGSLWPYHPEIRHFKNGAFDFAVRNCVPVVPLVYHFVPVTGFRKHIKRKPFIHVSILPPIFPNACLSHQEAVEELKNESYTKMQSMGT